MYQVIKNCYREKKMKMILVHFAWTEWKDDEEKNGTEFNTVTGT